MYGVPKPGPLLQVLMILCLVMLVEDVHGINQVLLDGLDLGIHPLYEYVHRDFDLLHCLGECVDHLRRLAHALICVVQRVSLQEILLKLGVRLLQRAREGLQGLPVGVVESAQVLHKVQPHPCVVINDGDAIPEVSLIGQRLLVLALMRRGGRFSSFRFGRGGCTSLLGGLLGRVRFVV